MEDNSNCNSNSNDFSQLDEITRQLVSMKNDDANDYDNFGGEKKTQASIVKNKFTAFR